MRQLSYLTGICILLICLCVTASASVAPRAIPTITVSYGNESGDLFQISEVQGLVALRATLSEAQPTDVTFQYTLTPMGTASRLEDFALSLTDANGIPIDPAEVQTTATVLFPAGSTEALFPLTIIDDRYDEADETVIFNLGNAVGGVLIQQTMTILIIDEDDPPIISLNAPGFRRNSDGSISAAINENDGGIPLQLIIGNNRLSSFPLNVKYEIVQNEGVDPLFPDYLSPGELIIPAQAAELNFYLLIESDVIPESQEIITLRLLPELTANAIIHPTDNTLQLTINDNTANAGAINDTGVTTCYDDLKNPIIPCDTALFPGQDGETILGNRYLKIDAEGRAVNSNATVSEFSCVYDQNTGLVWQVTKNQESYTWYNSVESVNGGDPGFEGAEGLSTCNDPPCNTDHYRTTLNTLEHSSFNGVGLCNVRNWRPPKVHELISIMDFEPANGVVLIDDLYFPLRAGSDKPASAPTFYWTANPVALQSDSAWCVYFGKTQLNHVQHCSKKEPKLLRMVATCGFKETLGALDCQR